MSLAAATEVSALVLEVRVTGELLLRRQISLLRADVVEHSRVVASGGGRPPHLWVLLLSPLVDDARLDQLALAILASELVGLADLDGHAGDLRFLAFRCFFVLQGIVRRLYRHLIDHVPRREWAVCVGAEHARG